MIDYFTEFERMCMTEGHSCDYYLEKHGVSAYHWGLFYCGQASDKTRSILRPVCFYMLCNGFKVDNYPEGFEED